MEKESLKKISEIEGNKILFARFQGSVFNFEFKKSLHMQERTILHICKYLLTYFFSVKKKRILSLEIYKQFEKNVYFFLVYYIDTIE